MPTFEEIWKRIEAHAGEDFRQKRGQVFSYKVTGGSLTPSTTTWNIPRSQFEKAYVLVPLEGPGDIKSNPLMGSERNRGWNSRLCVGRQPHGTVPRNSWMTPR